MLLRVNNTSVAPEQRPGSRDLNPQPWKVRLTLLLCLPEHGEAAAAVRHADGGMWSLLADAAAAHHHLRVRLEVRTQQKQLEPKRPLF